MKRSLASLLALALIQGRACAEDITAAAGNSAGQSPQVAAEGTELEEIHILRPGRMFLWSAQRVGSDAVRLAFDYPDFGETSADPLIFFRAKNNEPWQQVVLNVYGSHFAYDANAQAGNEYRYTACLVRRSR